MNEWHDRVLALRDRHDDAAARRIESAIREQVRGALDTIREQGAVQLDETPLRRAIEAINRDVWEDAFLDTTAFFGSPQKALPVLIDELLRFYIETNAFRRLDVVHDTTRRALMEELLAGLREGLDNRDIAERIEQRWLSSAPDDGPVSDGRARRVARTEVAAAQNAGSFVGARQVGMTHKRWMSVGDARTRGPGGIYPNRGYDHRSKWDPENNPGGTDGQERRIADPFIVSGESLMYPGDGSIGASAGNLVNCRCAVNYFFRR